MGLQAEGLGSWYGCQQRWGGALLMWGRWSSRWLPWEDTSPVADPSAGSEDP